MISNSQRFVCSVLSIAGAASLVAFADPAHAAGTRPSDLRQASLNSATSISATLPIARGR